MVNDTNEVLRIRSLIIPFAGEYCAGGRPINSPECFDYINRKLQTIGETWRITEANSSVLLGLSVVDGHMEGANNAIVIIGGGGNIFSNVNASDVKQGVVLKNTSDNSFDKININQPTNKPE